MREFRSRAATALQNQIGVGNAGGDTAFSRLCFHSGDYSEIIWCTNSEHCSQQIGGSVTARAGLK
jgi:hypothetical protein